MRICTSVLIFVLLLLMPCTTLAAFPVAQARVSDNPSVATFIKTGYNVSSEREPVTPNVPAPRQSRDGTLGIISLVLGVAGWVMVFMAGTVSIFGLFAIACAVGAVVTGAIGLGKGMSNKGLATAGLLLGAAELLIVGAVIYAFSN